MDENTLNSASTQSSTGTNWLSGLIDRAAEVGAAYLTRNRDEETRPVQTPATATNWTPIAIIGGAGLLLLVLFLALRK